ncbi:hypothetical protein GCM10012275_42690 [Longimycelium tulufanense]|uniref:Uncharacterized protein n=1 Tax=Longimycelium tulufanense TaxID=907463 RepID=A0A8J3CIP6_9PSEU|nr:AAA family ATPase [Longimycelium tulufanense]GGM67592.1 hypothetical protein GCM10012275_42690 [Longimycelium tulufanense]
MTGQRPRLAYDWQSDTVYIPRWGRTPRVELVTHTHTCPDGTPVHVTAQWVVTTSTTVYRWLVDGQPAGTTTARCGADTPPDWSAIDATHPSRTDPATLTTGEETTMTDPYARPAPQATPDETPISDVRATIEEKVEHPAPPITAPTRPTVPALKTRKPTGRVAPPLILVEGGEKAGKTWLVAEFTASPRISQAYWIEWGEKECADEYGLIPGADYTLIDHDGSFETVANQVYAVRAVAQQAAEADQPPMCLVIDTMTWEWEILKDWANKRALSAPSVRARLTKNPDLAAEDIPVPMNIWNEVTERHYKLMRLLQTFPGVVVMTARGKEVTALDDAGRPIPGAKTYKVEGHKNLAYDASVWLRLSREHPPLVVGARSVRAGIRPGVDKPRSVPDLTLDWLVFDVLGYRPDLAAPTAA